MNSIRLATGSAALALAASLAAPAFAGEVAGVVADASETAGLDAVEVVIEELGRRTVTQRDGSYLIGDVPAGTYTITARYVGAQPQQFTVTVPATGTVRQNFVLGESGSNILVLGQGANLASALSRKKAADGVSDVLTRDAIGQFPDQNVAESLRRLPGVNILNDQGEGRFVSIRGLDPQLNATSLNGVRLPAPESDTRAVALDVLSSDLIESIEIKKSLTPDMDADTIGASIEIRTPSVFDRKKDLLTLTAEGSYNEYSDEVTPKGALDFAKRLGENFGVAGGVSYYERKFETDNVEADFWETSASGVDYSPGIEYRDYDVERTRISTYLSFDLRATDTTKLYLRGNWSQFDDQEYRRRLVILPSGEPVGGDADSAQFSDTTGAGGSRIEVRRDNKDRFERQRIRSLVLGGDTDTGEWKVGWLASYAKSTEREDFSLDPTRFRARFTNAGVGIDFDFSDERVPLYSLTGGAAAFNDPTRYSFNRLELTDLSDSQDEEFALKADIARVFALGDGELTVQAGAKQRWRDKSYDFNLTFFGGYDGDYTLADVLGPYRYPIVDLGPMSGRTAPTDFFLANAANFEVDDYETALGSAIEDYSVTEDITAGYLMGRYETGQLLAIGGVRVERTSNELNGNTVLDAEPDVIVTPVSFERDYTQWLPSLTLRYAAQSDLILRAAAYRSLVRPRLSRLAPRFTINEDGEAEFGNPDLQPFEAWNFDGTVEYYMSSNGAITAGVFYKRVKNFEVVIRDGDPGSFNGVDYQEALIPINGDSGDIFGFEASFAQTFDMLPAPFDGMLFQANYTYTDATGSVPTDGDLADLRDIELPSASKNTFNVVLGYSKGGLDLRAAGTYRDGYLDELGDDAETDRFVDNHFQLDLSARYDITKQIRVFAEWINVNDAKYFAFQNFNDRRRLLQYEAYGSTFKFGVRANF
ncbi:TonB-dependent receptor [Erythrobacter donghaensis]|uniref:TonB-dependent receptor n=1 Tax=Erythrobacter donghaensis TaxID=267135 RepID=UPI000A3A0ED0|nr:TonB-dependent receptor [Erythrobacter donghaensis]